VKHPPREGDLPREELVKLAEYAIGPKGQWPGATLMFKFTCEHCGERCTLQESNTLYEEGECFACGKMTKIEFGGFMVHYVVGGKT
jgi:hypothetical protein